MLLRTESFFDWFGIDGPPRAHAERLAGQAAEVAQGMTHLKDYLALAAVCVHRQPRMIFEIGTFLGVTSNFFLNLLPQSRVVSIAYVQPRIRLFGAGYNNTELSADEVGRMVTPENRPRFLQLLGDSHKLTPQKLLEQFGRFDLVFIDGDHSRDGVRQDTELAQAVLGPGGAICWHDANPKPKYLPVRQYLEDELPLPALATCDDYAGGVAYWNSADARRIGCVRAPAA